MQLFLYAIRHVGNAYTMIRTLLFLTLNLFLFYYSYSCSINPDPIPFCDSGIRGEGLIASGKIVKKIDHGFLIELHTVYRGDETRCQIKVFEQEDDDCNGIIFRYPRKTLGKLGDVILFKAAPVANAYNPPEWLEEGEYINTYADIKGYGRLRRPMVKKGNKFKGLFTEGVNSVRVENIAEELSACGIENVLAEPRQLCGEHPLNIYPNPSKDQVFIENLIEVYDEILLYDLNGKVIYRSSTYDASQGISVKEFNSGLYFVVVKSGSGSFRQKLIINH